MIFNKPSAQYVTYSMKCYTLSNVAKFMRQYKRRKMYTVGGARIEVLDLYKYLFLTVSNTC